VNERGERRTLDRRQRIEDEIASTPGSARDSQRKARRDFALGLLRSKWTIISAGVFSIDEITPVACKARTVDWAFPPGGPGVCPGGSTSSPPNLHDAPIISWINAPLGRAEFRTVSAVTPALSSGSHSITVEAFTTNGTSFSLEDRLLKTTAF
jgi:hypothetical protein